MNGTYEYEVRGIPLIASHPDAVTITATAIMRWNAGGHEFVRVDPVGWKFMGEPMSDNPGFASMVKDAVERYTRSASYADREAMRSQGWAEIDKVNKANGAAVTAYNATGMAKRAEREVTERERVQAALAKSRAANEQKRANAEAAAAEAYAAKRRAILAASEHA